MANKRKEFVYVVYDYDTDKEIGSFASFTKDTEQKMRDYLVKHGAIPNDAIVRFKGCTRVCSLVDRYKLPKGDR